MHEYRKYLKPSAFVGGGILLIIFSVILIFKSGVFTSSSVEIIESTSKPSVLGDHGQEVTVEVVGAVHKPGVYTLSVGSRIHDALVLAGDVTSAADTKLIEKTINRAAKIVDGQKIYIPKKGDEAVVPVVEATTTTGININSGSQSDLESLPGVGPVTAKKIIENRPYGNLDDLVSKKAVGATLFEKIKDLITLY